MRSGGYAGQGPRRGELELVNGLFLSFTNKQHDGGATKNDLGQEHLQIQEMRLGPSLDGTIGPDAEVAAELLSRRWINTHPRRRT